MTYDYFIKNASRISSASSQSKQESEVSKARERRLDGKNMKLIDLKANVKQWAIDRDLYENSSFEAQHSKYNEEKLELMDAIGDESVCAINEINLARNEAQLILAHKHLEIACNTAMAAGVDFEECLQMAWDSIKHRVGLMIGGKFVKWDNLHHDERVQVAESGQLNGEGVDIESLLKMCSDEEADEIRAVIKPSSC